MPDFKKRLIKAQPGENFRVLVYLKNQLDVVQMSAAMDVPDIPANYRHRTIVENLQKIAWDSQSQILSTLRNLRDKGKIEFYRGFWILNVINLKAPAGVILSLAKNPRVQSIVLDGRVYLETPVRRIAAAPAANSAEIGLKVINANKLWQKNITGQGIIVMNIDTGVDGHHPALNHSWRGAQPGVSLSEAWFDPEENSTFPIDPDGHGTHTMGIMVGLDTLTHDTIGVAFRAQWIAAKVLNQSAFQSNILAALQWAADPDGNPYTVDDVPAVINCSWRDPGEPYCATTYWNAVDNVEALGTAVIFSAGNQGPTPQSITPPKNRITSPVNFFAVGAIDPYDPNYAIAPFSSRGPSRCDSMTIKPEVVAPGVNIRSTIPGDSFAVFSGTSTAAPHVSGAVALLRSAYPFISGTSLKYALLNTARDLGATGEDNDYGTGLIDVWAAYLSLADPTDPTPPSNLIAYSDYRTPTSIRLQWQDPTHLVNGDTLLPGDFKIQIERDNLLIDSVSGGVQFYVDRNLTDGQQYIYRVYTKLIGNDSLSVPVEARWFAGGAPTPSPPLNFRVTGNDSVIRLFWKNPSTNIDGTPLDDFAGIYLYQDSVKVATFIRTPADTGKMDSSLFTPAITGYYHWHITAFDNEIPSHESTASVVKYTPLPLPFSDSFTTPGTPNPAFWNNSNADVNDRAVSPPSPPYALNLNGFPDGGDMVELKAIDLSGRENQGIIFSYFIQPQGNGDSPEVEDSLGIYFKNNLGKWILVKEYPGSFTKPFQKETLDLQSLPAGGGSYFFPGFQVRFKSRGTPSNSTIFDDWFIDDVYLGPRKISPEMIVYPAQISDTLFVGQTTWYSVVIRNNSYSTTPLDFTVVNEPPVNWLQFSPVTGSIGANQTDTVHLTISTQNLTAGLVQTNLIVSGNDTNNPRDTVKIELLLENPPQMQISADSLFMKVAWNWMDSTRLWIKNSGTGTLDLLGIVEEEIVPPATAELEMPQTPFEIFKKGENGKPLGEVIEGRGGPDAFGYSWMDSREAGGPVYHFTDISTSGDTVKILPAGSFAAKDEGFGIVSLPFSVLFYGKSYRHLLISTNGFITFDTLFTSYSYNNQAFPNSLPPNNVIAALWDDLSGVAHNGQIFTQQVGNQFIIQWNNWSYFDGSDSMKFQIILNKNSSIIFFEYANVLDRGTGTIGIENQNGTVGLTIAYNQIYGQSHLATRISPDVPWLNIVPTFGKVLPGDSLAIWFNASVMGLDPGVYMARSIIQSNDPYNPSQSVFIKMDVQATPQMHLMADSLIFDTTFVGRSGNASLKIMNLGAGDLILHDLFTNPPSLFSVDTGYFRILPGDSQFLGVHFTPPDSGNYQGILTLLTNDPQRDSLEMILKGDAVFPPIIRVSPVSIVKQVTENDSVDVALQITNAGQGKLRWQAIVGMSNNTLNGSKTQFHLFKPVEFKEDELKNVKRSFKSGNTRGKIPFITDSIFLKILPPNAGELLPGDSTNLKIRLYGMLPTIGDTLSAQIEIHSNDPGNPVLSIPIKETVLTGIPHPNQIPKTYFIAQNYPNPFNPSTTFKFQLPKISTVTLEIYDVLGRRIRTLIHKKFEPGIYEIRWDGKDDSGILVSSGVYLYRFQAGEYARVRKMLLIR